MHTLTIKSTLIVGIVVIFLLPVFAVKIVNIQAHGESFSIETEVDGYLIDIGQTPDFITANQSVRFAFDLLDVETNEIVPYTDVWVLIQKDGKKAIFASGIKQPKFGSTGMMFTFPESGEYELSVRYQNEGDSIVDTSIPITVIENPDSGDTDSPWIPVSTGGIGIVLGFAFAFMLRKRT